MSTPTRTVFRGSSAELVGKLELPSDAPTAWALFAHCFTCGKDNSAAGRISRALASRGVAVLRFDFTGLGSPTVTSPRPASVPTSRTWSALQTISAISSVPRQF